MHLNQLSGSIPSWLLDMSSLTQLALGDNEFTGSIPSWLGDMNSLTGLFLHVNELTGSIPAKLGNLSNLTYMSLSHNQLDWVIPDELNLLANLETIFLQKNFELTGPAHLNFTALTHAELGYVKGETWAVADFSPATDWSLSSDDSDLFEISDDGLLAFKSPPDFVIPYTGSGDNVYFVDVTASVGGTQKKAEIVVVVMDRDIALSVSSSSIGEEDSATDFTVTATIDEAATEDTTVTLSLSGTATGSGADYTVGALPTVTILAGNTAGTATLSITPTDDEIVEGDEVIKVVGISGELAVSSAWITIDDDDEATLSLSGPSEAVVEGSEASFTVSLSDAIASDVTVEWSVTSGSATADDYGTSSGSVTFLANSGASSTQPFTIAVEDDDLSEGVESFTVSLGAITSDVADQVSLDSTASSVTVTISESDPITVTLSGDSSVEEGGAATYTVGLSPAGVTPTADLTVYYATDDDSAGSDDYAGVSETLTFTSSDTGDKTLTVQTTEDSIAESDESFSFILSNVSGGGGPTPSLANPPYITTTIQDDDAEPTAITLSVNPTEVSEGNGRTASVTVTATLDGDSTRSSSTTVTLSLSGTATGSGADYTAGALPTVTILAGNATGTATLSITPTDDEIFEGDETIVVHGTAVSLTVSSARITIDDDDATLFR